MTSLPKYHQIKGENKMNANVLFVRALKTFLQAFLAAVSVGIVTTTDISAVRGLIVGAIAAGISAAMNLLIQPTEAK